jgi:hypothetical protein
MLGWLAVYKYVTPTPQVGMALYEFVWEINQKIAPTLVSSSLDESKDSATTKSANPATNTTISSPNWGWGPWSCAGAEQPYFCGGSPCCPYADVSITTLYIKGTASCNQDSDSIPRLPGNIKLALN